MLPVPFQEWGHVSVEQHLIRDQYILYILEKHLIRDIFLQTVRHLSCLLLWCKNHISAVRLTGCTVHLYGLVFILNHNFCLTRLILVEAGVLHLPDS